MEKSKETPKLFSLLSKLTAEERQKFGEERRQRKRREGVREELLRDDSGAWSLAYFKGKKKLDELKISRF